MGWLDKLLQPGRFPNMTIFHAKFDDRCHILERSTHVTYTDIDKLKDVTDSIQKVKLMAPPNEEYKEVFQVVVAVLSSGQEIYNTERQDLVDDFLTRLSYT